MRKYGIYKKASKPTTDLIESQIFQAIKTVSKTVKTVKTFLVLKHTKKLTMLRENEDSSVSNQERLAEAVKAMEALKVLDHQAVATFLVQRKISFGGDPRYNKQLSTKAQPDESLIKSILQQKRVQDVLAEIQSKITSSIEKNNALRMEEDRTAEKQQQNSGTTRSASLFGKRKNVDGTRAVFVDSLDISNLEDDEKSKKSSGTADIVKLNKSLRNQANRKANRAIRLSEEKEHINLGAGSEGGISEYIADNAGSKRRRRDDNDPSLMMYRPVEERLAAAATTRPVANMRNKDNKDGTRSSAKVANGGGLVGRTSGKPGPVTSSSSSKLASRAGAPPLSDPTLAAAVVNGKDWKNTGVHPSWAAKQQAKKMTIGSIHINPSTGTSGTTGKGNKIVFDD